jgi:hypothetical protein
MLAGKDLYVRASAASVARVQIPDDDFRVLDAIPDGAV